MVWGLGVFMHYLIYKITNTINGKIYIGKHITEDLNDGYMGSGTAIKNAIKKYGEENFSKEILFDVYGEDLMNLLEEAIVDEAFVKRKDTYNLKVGGEGGWDYVNSKPKSSEAIRKAAEANRGQRRSEETRQKISDAKKGKPSPLKGKPRSDEFRRKDSESHKGHSPGNKGKRHSEETRQKISQANKGKKHGPMSEETRRKIAEAHKKRLSNQANNGFQ